MRVEHIDQIVDDLFAMAINRNVQRTRIIPPIIIQCLDFGSTQFDAIVEIVVSNSAIDYPYQIFMQQRLYLCQQVGNHAHIYATTAVVRC